jgi:hypothetical protein
MLNQFVNLTQQRLKYPRVTDEDHVAEELRWINA